MLKRLSILLLLGAFLATAPVHAQTGEGLDAFQQQNYALALRKLLPAARGGDVVAQRFVGLIYLQGLGVRRDAKQGVAWLEKARAQGDRDAGYFVGLARYYGDGVRQNLRQAFSLFESAAVTGHDGAALMLARMYHAGQGVGRDDRAAVHWYMTAARYHPEALHELGEVVLQLDPAPVARTMAYTWFLLAHWAGDQAVEEHLQTAARQLTPQELKHAEQLARAWQPSFLPQPGDDFRTWREIHRKAQRAI